MFNDRILEGRRASNRWPTRFDDIMRGKESRLALAHFFVYLSEGVPLLSRTPKLLTVSNLLNCLYCTYVRMKMLKHFRNKTFCISRICRHLCCVSIVNIFQFLYHKIQDLLNRYVHCIDRWCKTLIPDQNTCHWGT